MNYLFICSRNQWRSPERHCRASERIFAKDYGIHTRSAGTSAQAKHKITTNDIAWADVIFVMEHKHKQRIKADFAKPCQFKTIVVLDIPDDYHYMDAELIELLQQSMQPYLML